jgi:hypothetical protein
MYSEGGVMSEAAEIQEIRELMAEYGVTCIENVDIESYVEHAWACNHVELFDKLIRVEGFPSITRLPRNSPLIGGKLTKLGLAIPQQIGDFKTFGGSIQRAL